MKVICLFALQLTLLGNFCFAGPLIKGDIVKVEQSGFGGASGGGEFVLSKLIAPNSWEFAGKTFCLELNESFAAGEELIVGGVGNRAVFGGNNTQLGDPLSNRTKNVFASFSNGTLNSSVPGYSYNDTPSANALQEAIWKLEGERSSPLSQLAKDLMSWSSTAANSSVFALNLFAKNTPDAAIAAFNQLDSSTWAAVYGYQKQDLLYTRALVPEPTSIAIFLIGLGCAGTARLRSSRRKAKNSKTAQESLACSAA